MIKFFSSIYVRLHPTSVFLFKYQFWFTLCLLFIAFLLTYLNYPELNKDSIYNDLPKEVGSFLNVFVDPGDSLKNVWTFYAQFFAFFAFSLVILAGLFRESIHKSLYKAIAHSKHNLVIGLGENNRVYLDSECLRVIPSKIIIIEPDANNPHLDAYREKGFGVFIGSIEDYAPNFSKLEHVIISAGDDRLNIDIAGELKSKLDEKNLNRASFGCKTTVHIHLTNQSYKALFYENLLIPKQDFSNSNEELPWEYKMFSYEDSAARNLFMQDTVLGNRADEMIQSKDAFSVIVVGNGVLAERVIYHLIMMASLPNKNTLNLYLYSQDSTAFIEKLRTLFFNFDSKISNLHLHGKDLNLDKPEAWDRASWLEPHIKNLTQVYICHDDESLNLQTTIKIHERFYLDATNTKKTKAKVNFAMYHNLALSEVINENSDTFKDFHAFGDAKKIFSYENLIDENHEKIAKLIHHGYGEKVVSYEHKSSTDEKPAYKPLTEEQIEEKWIDIDKIKFSDRESSRSQALHMFTKLKALGVDVDYEKKLYFLPTIASNKNDFREYLVGKNEGEPSNGLDIDEGFILKDIELLGRLVHKSYNGFYMDAKDMDAKIVDWIFKRLTDGNSLLSKLIIAEHERWNRFHFLNGWKHVDEGEKDKPLKRHDCLKPINEFKSPDLRKTVLFDLYSILYLDLYLQETGFKPVQQKKIEKQGATATKNNVGSSINISIGVTGKRDLVQQGKKNQKVTIGYLKQLFDFTKVPPEIKIKNDIVNALEQLFENKEDYRDAREIKITIVSPLAEGADRVFVEAIQELVQKSSKIKIDGFNLFMPFDREDYIEGFGNFNGKNKEQQKTEFNQMSKCEYYSIEASQFTEVSICSKVELAWEQELHLSKPRKDFKGEYPDSCYFRLGQAVVDHSDIMFAIRDPAESYIKDDGGTESIVKYFNDKNEKLKKIDERTKTMISITL